MDAQRQPTVTHPAATPCRWLGAWTGDLRRCPTCAGYVDLKIMICERFGRCTVLRHVDGLRCCCTCPEKEPKEDRP